MAKQKRSNKYVYFIDTRTGIEAYNNLYELLDAQGIRLRRMNNEANAYGIIGKNLPALKKMGSSDPVVGEWLEFPAIIDGMPIYRLKKSNVKLAIEFTINENSFL